MSRVFAYCRVSTADQTTDNQIQEISAAGFTVQKGRVITETVSGSVPAMERKGFLALLNKLEASDVLIVTKLDRLGRNAMDVLASVERLASMHVRVHCLALGGVDLTSSAGRFTMTVIAAVAEFERSLLVERTQSGLARAKAQGKVLGRPRSVDVQAIQQIVSRLSEGETVAALAREFGTSRQSIMRIRHTEMPSSVS
jgi:putative DNA-invertase from lambdoid prophage Rac